VQHDAAREGLVRVALQLPGAAEIRGERFGLRRGCLGFGLVLLVGDLLKKADRLLS